MRVWIQWYPVSRRSQWYFEVPQVLIILGVLAGTLWLQPAAEGYGTHEQLGLPPCPSQQILGVPCPSCGLTTCFANMSHAHLGAAFRAHYFGPFLFALMVGYLFLLIFFLVRGQRAKFIGPGWVPYAFFFGGMGAYLLCWVVRVAQTL